MKYIRTNKAIYEVVKEQEASVIIKLDDMHCPYPRGNIIKQADTIEELCDKYYGVDEDGEVCRVYNWSKDAYPPKPHEWAVDGFCTKEDITISELKNQFPKGIFGAIVWFDSEGNLHIYIVAKMNDKGELELL